MIIYNSKLEIVEPNFVINSYKDSEGKEVYDLVFSKDKVNIYSTEIHIKLSYDSLIELYEYLTEF